MAVFTPVSTQEAEAYLRVYDIGAVRRFEAIEEGVSNTNFCVETDQGQYVLTLFEAVTPEADLPFFMEYTAYLDRVGFPAPGPVQIRDGAYLGRLNGKPAALIKWLEGRWPREAGPSHAFEAGAWLARLHGLGEGFNGGRANSMGQAKWADLLTRCAAQTSKFPLTQAMVDDLGREYEALITLWPQDLPLGIIHADYFIDNVLMDASGRLTGVIDYYYACTDFYAYDLAIALNAWGFTPGGQPQVEMLTALSEGYQSERPLSQAEIAALPILCRGAALRFTLTRLHDLLHHDPSWRVLPKDPEAFYRRLIFHRGIISASEYGFA